MIKILDFYTDWCQPCKRIAPMLDDLTKRLSYVTIEKINVDENFKLADQYQIQNIPTLLFFKGDVLVDKIVGVPTMDKLVGTVQKHLKE